MNIRTFSAKEKNKKTTSKHIPNKDNLLSAHNNPENVCATQDSISQDNDQNKDENSDKVSENKVLEGQGQREDVILAPSEPSILSE